MDKIQFKTQQPAILTETLTQLDEYFNGKRKIFTVKLHLEETEFQTKV